MKKVFALFVILFILTFGFTTINPVNSENLNILGNSTGNVINGGTAVKYKDSIYYIAKNRLMVMDLNGKNRKQVIKGNYFQLNVVQNYIYFADGEMHVLKIKPGENKLIPVDAKKSYYNLVFYNNNIYYTDDYQGNLYKADLNCKNPKVLAKGRYTGIVVSGGWIYSQSLNPKGSTTDIYRISTDGLKKMKLGNSPMLNAYVNINGDVIYYCDNNSNLYSMKIDGSNRQKICGDKCSFINYDSGWIYFCDVSDHSKLYKIKPDGSNKTLVSSDSVEYINIVDNIITYFSVNEMNIFMIKTDGTGRTAL